MSEKTKHQLAIASIIVFCFFIGFLFGKEIGAIEEHIRVSKIEQEALKSEIKAVNAEIKKFDDNSIEAAHIRFSQGYLRHLRAMEIAQGKMKEEQLKTETSYE